MPTPNGVNNLLQFLVILLIPQLSKYKNQKWTFCIYVLQFAYGGIVVKSLWLLMNDVLIGTVAKIRKKNETTK